MDQALATVIASVLTLVGVVYTARASRHATRGREPGSAYQQLVEHLRARIADLEQRQAADAAYIRVLVRMMQLADIPIPAPPHSGRDP